MSSRRHPVAHTRSALRKADANSVEIIEPASRANSVFSVRNAQEQFVRQAELLLRSFGSVSLAFMRGPTDPD